MTKELNFMNVGDRWISEEFTVSGDFNLHVERKGCNIFALRQKTSGTRYASVPGAAAYVDSSVIDVDVQVLVGPKSFIVISYSKVTAAQITEI